MPQDNFTYSIWGSPKKRKQKFTGDGEAAPPHRSKKRKKSGGNWQRVEWETWEKCRICELEKKISSLCKGVKHHGALCHFCFRKLQFYSRKYEKNTMALSAFSDVQLSFIASESKAARKQAVEAAGLKKTEDVD